MAAMPNVYERFTVDLTAYSNLIYIELGLRPVTLGGYLTALQLLKPIHDSVHANPEGLLQHNLGILFVRFRPHFLIRQYWRSVDDLERWARTGTHANWWQAFAKDTRGTMIWHEAYSLKGGVDAIYASTQRLSPVGLLAFAPRIPATGSAFASRSACTLAEKQLCHRLYLKQKSTNSTMQLK